MPLARELFLSHPSFQRGLDLILEAVAALQADAGTVDADSYSAQLQRVARLRGRPLFFPYIGSGLGRGVRVLTADGRWLLDFAIGIGVHFFGHSHPDLLRAALTAAASDVEPMPASVARVDDGPFVPRDDFVDRVEDRVAALLHRTQVGRRRC